MNDPQQDPLEARLQRLRPKPVSDGLRNRLAREMPKLPPDEAAGSAPASPPSPIPLHDVPRTRLWWGLAAGVVAAVSVGWFAIQESVPPSASIANRAVEAGPRPLSTTAINTNAPSLAVYTRAAAIDDAALDKLLDQHAQVLLVNDSAPLNGATLPPQVY